MSSEPKAEWSQLCPKGNRFLILLFPTQNLGCCHT